MAGNMFLKLSEPYVRGEAGTGEHQGEIEVLSWNHSFAQPAPAVGDDNRSAVVEQAHHSKFTFTKYIDAATDDLLKLCWSGRKVAKGVFCAYRRDSSNQRVNFLRITMEKIIVADVAIGGGSSDIPAETISLSYDTIEYQYFPSQGGETASHGERVKHDLVHQSVS